MTVADISVATASIDHDTMLNTHNLTTDIDHNTITNMGGKPHIDWSTTTTDNIHSGNYTNTTYSGDTWTVDITSEVVSAVTAGIDHNTLLNTHNLTTDLNRTVTTKTGNYNPAVNRDIVLMNGTYTVTLNGSPVLNDIVDVKNIGSGTVTVDGNGNTIDGESTISLYQYESVCLVSDGSNWFNI